MNQLVENVLRVESRRALEWQDVLLVLLAKLRRIRHRRAATLAVHQQQQMGLESGIAILVNANISGTLPSAMMATVAHYARMV